VAGQRRRKKKAKLSGLTVVSVEEGGIQEAAGLRARLLCGSWVVARGWKNKREDGDGRERRWRKKGGDSMGENMVVIKRIEKRERRYVGG